MSSSQVDDVTETTRVCLREWLHAYFTLYSSTPYCAGLCRTMSKTALTFLSQGQRPSLLMSEMFMYQLNSFSPPTKPCTVSHKETKLVTELLLTQRHKDSWVLNIHEAAIH